MKKIKTPIILHVISLVILILSGTFDLIRGPYFYLIDFILSLWFVFMLVLYFLWLTKRLPQNLKTTIILETISIAVFFVYLMQIRGYENYSPMDLIMCCGAVVYIGYTRYKKSIRKQSGEVPAV